MATQTSEVLPDMAGQAPSRDVLLEEIKTIEHWSESSRFLATPI